MEIKWEKLKRKYCYVKKTKKNPETDGYERDRNLKSEKTKKKRNMPR